MWDLLKFGVGCFVAIFTIVNPFSAAGLLVLCVGIQFLIHGARAAFPVLLGT